MYDGSYENFDSFRLDCSEEAIHNSSQYQDLIESVVLILLHLLDLQRMNT